MNIIKKGLIVVPHQDDEILGCSILLSRNHFQIHDLWFIVKGGGEDPTRPNLSSDELYRIRCEESKKALATFKNIDEIIFFGIERPGGKHLTKGKFLNFLKPKLTLQKHDLYDQIITTSEFDKHDEHQALGAAMKELSDLHDFQHKLLSFYVDKSREKNVKIEPSLDFELNDSELKLKRTLVKFFESQKHFLPNIVERPEYKFERFYWE